VKILHVVASYLPAVRYGGTIVSVHGLCRALARRGHDVHVYTTSVDGADDSAVVHNSGVDLDGVRVWYFKSTVGRRVYYAPALGAMLRHHVGEFAVVHTHAVYLWPLWYAARTAKAASIPYVVSPRGMLEKELLERQSLVLKAALIGFFEKRTLEHAAAIHVTSPREAGKLRQFGFDLPPLCEVPNGVDAVVAGDQPVTPLVAAIIADGPYVLYLGRINWKKGLDRLLRALAQAPRTRVVLAGHDDENHREFLESIAAANGVAERVIFCGAVSGSDKTALLGGADALVLPSYSENFGNVVLEAMAFGRPVIVTPEVGIADLVHESGAGMVVAGDPVALGGVLARLTDDRPFGDALGARGRTVAAARFTWDAVATQMERLYERVAVGQPPC
jgi:glycosyltransferase involved in cell wall biosynthesis